MRHSIIALPKAADGQPELTELTDDALADFVAHALKKGRERFLVKAAIVLANLEDLPAGLPPAEGVKPLEWEMARDGYLAVNINWTERGRPVDCRITLDLCEEDTESLLSATMSGRMPGGWRLGNVLEPTIDVLGRLVPLIDTVREEITRRGCWEVAYEQVERFLAKRGVTDRAEAVHAILAERYLDDYYALPPTVTAA